MKEMSTIIVRAAPQPGLRDRYVEMCQHKGIGHPDTIANGVCEAAACELAATYRREFGRILHFNLDKGLLVAGRSEPRFGSGRVVRPIKLIICGRASNPGRRLALDEIVVRAASRPIVSSSHTWKSRRPAR